MEKLRGEIDHIDRELLFLFKKRFNLSKKIGELKKDLKLPINNLTREQQVVNNLDNFNYLKKDDINRIWSVIFNISKEKQ